jgi:hypothetical protein
LAVITAAARQIAPESRDEWFEGVRRYLARIGTPQSPRRATEAELEAAFASAREELTIAARPIPLRFADPPRIRRAPVVAEDRIAQRSKKVAAEVRRAE